MFPNIPNLRPTEVLSQSLRRRLSRLVSVADDARKLYHLANATEPYVHPIPTSSGRVEPTPKALAGERSLLNAEFGVEVLFSLTLWSVKFSFLVFFRRLGSNIRGQNVWWWCVMGFTIAALVTIIGTLNYQCESRSLGYISSKRSLQYQFQRANRVAAHYLDPSNVRFQWAIVDYHVSMDIITDTLRKCLLQFIVHD